MLGKSGNYYMNPNEAKRRGDMPDAPPEAAGLDAEANNDDAQQGAGDGLRHHQIDEMPEGTAHSTQTNADGTIEEEDHPSYEDACASVGGGDEEEGDEQADAGAPPPMDDGGGGDDMAGMYEKAGKRG